MLQLNNKTSYLAEGTILLDIDGSEIWVVAVKATFEIRNGKPVLADKQEPVCLVDEYFGEPGNSSVKYENELVFKKPGTDIIVNGHAYSPNGRPLTKLDVSVRCHQTRKVIRVYGNRIWYKSIKGLSISDPQPFVKMPLVYERAFGGIDDSSEDPKKHGAEERNPIGVGFGLSTDYLKDKPLPNLEDPADKITTWKNRPKPVGLGFICKHWQPRRQYAGTYDQKWMEERMPLYPLDFDFRFFLAAPADLVAMPHLRGGESVELLNLTPAAALAFSLPRMALGFRTHLAGKWIDHHGTLGSVIIEPDIPRVMLVWQTLIPCHRKKLDLKETQIFEKEVVSWN